MNTSMDNYSTSVAGVRVSGAEQEAMMSSEVKSLECARDDVLDQITALERTIRKQKSAADTLDVKVRIQVLKKDARRRLIAIDQLIVNLSKTVARGIA